MRLSAELLIFSSDGERLVPNQRRAAGVTQFWQAPEPPVISFEGLPHCAQANQTGQNSVAKSQIEVAYKVSNRMLYGVRSHTAAWLARCCSGETKGVHLSSSGESQ